MIQSGSKKWEATAVGYFLGRKPPFHQVSASFVPFGIRLQMYLLLVNGFFFIQFTNYAAMEEVIDGGPWLFQGQQIVLQRWTPGMALRKHGHTQVLIWIKIRHLPVELWTTDGLSTIASGIGRPLYPDAIIKASTRLDFARVCVMVNFNLSLPKHLVLMFLGEDGSEQPYRVDIEYKWVPSKCLTCRSLGHPTAGCPSTKKTTKPPVAVYVQKPPNRPSKEPTTVVEPDVAIPSKEKDVDGTFHDLSPRPVPTAHKGKEIVVFNPFNALTILEDDNLVEWGPNASSPHNSIP
ncbi:UNVERIFIED_CONTAM: hypothetical protein Slati_0895400 [Sesamum latifolium]|uniref:DUF4283 domain-containing protein n=1 Tax=Sesamum latifolium TaxID=2727402 RepID=A0AAW2XN58_9LAMI